jgi:hypothetical protein
VSGGSSGSSDLAVTNFYLTNSSGNAVSSFAPGAPIYPAVTIENYGPGPTYSSQGVFFVSIFSNQPNTLPDPSSVGSDVNVYVIEYGSIAAGQSKTYSITSNASQWGQTNWSMSSPGSYTARAFVDPFNFTSDRNTGNNQMTSAYTVAASPVNGVCGPAAMSYPNGSNSFSGALCSAGSASPSNPAFPSAGNSVNWVCQGSNGGSSPTCTASQAANVSQPLSVTFGATPSSGSAPLAVTLTATASGGTGGTYNYTFWQDCSYSYSGTPSVSGATTACGAPTYKDDTTPALLATTTITYQYGASSFHPLVIIENGSTAVAATSTVTASLPPGGCVPNTTQNCTSGANVCGMTSSGIETCGSNYAWGSCNVTTPANSACGYVCNQTNYTCGFSTTPTSTTQAQCAAACVAPPPVVISSFASSATGPIVPPITATLTWASSGATSCSVSPSIGNVGTSGSTVVSPTATTTYVLTCTGPGGSATKSLTVTVSSTGLQEVNPQ